MRPDQTYAVEKWSKVELDLLKLLLLNILNVVSERLEVEVDVLGFG